MDFSRCAFIYTRLLSMKESVKYVISVWCFNKVFIYYWKTFKSVFFCTKVEENWDLYSLLWMWWNPPLKRVQVANCSAKIMRLFFYEAPAEIMRMSTTYIKFIAANWFSGGQGVRSKVLRPTHFQGRWSEGQISHDVMKADRNWRGVIRPNWNLGIKVKIMLETKDN